MYVQSMQDVAGESVSQNEGLNSTLHKHVSADVTYMYMIAALYDQCIIIIFCALLATCMFHVQSVPNLTAMNVQFLIVVR